MYTINRIGRANRLGYPSSRRRGAPFVPSSLPGLFAAPSVAQARTQGDLWQDASKTTPAVADGDPVRVVVCPFTAVEFTAPTDAQRPLLKQVGSLWYLLFDGTDDFLAFSGPASKPLSMHMAAVATNLSNPIAAFSAPAGGQKFKLSDSGSGNKKMGGKEGAYNWSPSTTAATVNLALVAGLDYGSTGAATYYHSGVSDGVGDANTSDDTFTASLSRIGANAAGSELMVGRIYSWAIYTIAQGGNNCRLIHRWLGATAGVSVP